MTCAIEIQAPAHIPGTTGARKDWATVTGKPLVLSPPVFHHIESNEYCCGIVGGIAYPTADKPGIIIIIGLQNEPVRFRVLETYEDANVFELIQKVIDLRVKYGFGLDSRILPGWFGDQEKFQTLIVKASTSLEDVCGVGRGLYIKDTVDLRERHAFPLYVRQIFDTLKSKRLDLAGDMILTGHLQGFQRQDAEKGRVEDFPAVGLLGGMVHSLQVMAPWLEDPDGTDTAFNLD